MKKMYLIGALMLMGVGATLFSCGDKDSISNGCKCTITSGGQTETFVYTMAEVKTYCANTCSALAVNIKNAAVKAASTQGEDLKDYSVTCKAR